ncbi:MAG: segregation/condensation protein A [Flexilinea sp.]|nr:segregation/condensation protein A [Flexilinea sp.]
MAVQPVFFHSGQYRIKTDLYQGPLDLLLDLIEKAELDITVLSLAQVTDQFLEYVRAMEEENPTEVSAFVVIAARLIQIKSAALLPRQKVNIDNVDEDTGEALAQQLITYRRFKMLSDSLAEREDRQLRSWLRTGAPDVGLEPALDISGWNGGMLARIAARVFVPPKKAKSLEKVIKKPRLSIHDKIRMLVSRIRKSAVVRFSSLLRTGNKNETVVTFLAMLELIKQNAVTFRQESNFSDIEIEKTAAFDETRDFRSEFGD